MSAKNKSASLSRREAAAQPFVASALRTLETEREGLAALKTAIADGLGTSFVAAVDSIRQARGRLIVSGMGKSGHIARKIAATVKALDLSRFDMKYSAGALHHEDMSFNSPYNTYKNAGLPPGPIANPGKSALEAAMHPAQSDFLYFVADAQGHHRFAKTIEEHNKNVAAYRKAMRGQ